MRMASGVGTVDEAGRDAEAAIKERLAARPRVSRSFDCLVCGSRGFRQCLKPEIAA